MDQHNWYDLTIKEVLDTLSTSESGLSDNDAQSRLLQFGPNQIEKKKEVPIWKVFLAQFNNFLILILVIAAVISGAVGEYLEAIAIIVIVILAGVLGFIQEYKAEKALEALKKMSALKARVIREGEEKEIPAFDVVCGDILSLRVGDKIPADARLFETNNLKVEEASLTGESQAVDKTHQVISGQNIPLGDRNNMVFTGTYVTYGRGLATVVAIGMQTEFGKIAKMLQNIEVKKTPLQISIDRTAKWIGIFALVISSLIGIFGVIQGHSIIKMFVWAVALAVAIVPEALPAVMTISLALGVRRMSKQNALIRKLQAVETLGAVSIICTDKTGTLTEDQMTVRNIWFDNQTAEVSGLGYEPKGDFSIQGKLLDSNNAHLNLFLNAASLCNDSLLKNEEGFWKIVGDPTEGALIVTAIKAGIDISKLRQDVPRIDEIPFSSERKRMTTIHTDSSGSIAFSKGAIEIILDSCSFIHKEGKVQKIESKDRENVLNSAHSMSQEALRLLGVAYRKLDSNYSTSSVESEMVFLGMVGMMDPPRKGVKEAVETCKKAGIKTIMITGDHQLTAMAIAKELGILENGRSLTGAELDEINDEDFEKIIDEVRVYARVSPAHKLRIIDMLAKKGKVVAMTGDGVNDAPALKKADIGVAMGITGTDVSKEVSDMILTDDNFISIVKAVEEGRTIFANIRKFLTYLFTDNLGAVFAFVAAIFLKLPIPMTALQILFINMLMDGPNAIALGLEPPELGIMKNPPRDPNTNILNRHSLGYIFGMGFLISLVVLGVYIWALGRNNLYAMTMFFVTLIMVRAFNAFNCRSATLTLFKLGLFKNRWLLLAFLLTIITTLSIIYLPFLQKIFEVVPLNLKDWLIVFSASSIILVADEIGKLWQWTRNKTSFNSTD